MGLDISLYDGDQSAETPSLKYPDHYSNRGYLRSSYNNRGFNQVVGKLIGKDLYYIFDPIEPDYENDEEDAFYVPYPKEHLEQALDRAKEVLEELKEAPRIGMMTTSHNPFAKDHKWPNALEAMNIVKDFLEKEKEQAFSTLSGDFFLNKPLRVIAILPGKDFMGECMHIAYEYSEEIFQHYIQLAEIVIEFIENALTLKDPRIGWSA